jgi:hypothetical protein
MCRCPIAVEIFNIQQSAWLACQAANLFQGEAEARIRAAIDMAT